MVSAEPGFKSRVCLILNCFCYGLYSQLLNLKHKYSHIVNFKHSFLLVNKCLYDIQYVPGPVLGAAVTVVKKKVVCSQKAYLLAGTERQKQNTLKMNKATSEP